MSQAQSNALVFEWQARTTPDWPVHRLIIVKAAADNHVVVDDERRIGRTGARCALALLLERALDSHQFRPGPHVLYFRNRRQHPTS
jgi:hypothetical protein